jgi:hypothetical protein
LPGRGDELDAFIIGAACAGAGAIARLVYTGGRHPRIATLVERRAPQCRNVLITAVEIIEGPARVTPYVGTLVCREAARVIGALDPVALFPSRRPVAALGVSAALWMTAVLATDVKPLRAPTLSDATAEISRIEITVVPPPYAARPTQSLRDPARIAALAGSQLRVTVRARAASVSMETVGGKTSLAPSGDQMFSGEIVADADGFVAIEPVASSGRAGVRRLIGLSVTADQPPRVRITAPGKDLFLPDPRRTLAVTIDAGDDLALASLRLRYTRVSGAGELFTFTDGEVPVDIVRTDDRAWKASGSLRLDALGLVPGDMVVYRGVATDRRPGAPPSESDSYIVEITAPGSVAAEGFAVDDDRDRYGISQQMVILKTERLIARGNAVTGDSLNMETMALAAEQRAVRAEFVFMMGGELAEEVLSAANLTDLNEEAEAAGEDDIAAGRLANRGRIDLVRAIRSMSQAAASLARKNLPTALTQERSALKYLQSAFSRTRYILRALTQRERLDVSRRMTGTLLGAARDAHPVVLAEPDARVIALRRALAGVSALAGTVELNTDAAGRASSLAQTVLQVDPSAPSLQRVAARLNDAAVAIERTQNGRARSLMDSAAVALAGAVRAGMPAAPARAPSLDVSRLDGALTDALRRGGSR